MNDSPYPADETLILKGVAGKFIQDSSRVYSNLGQEIIITTEDKIRLCLIEHLSRMEKRNAWITPLGILLTIVIVFPTTTFRDAFYLSAATWQAMFVIGGVICFGWLIRSIWNAQVSSSMNDVVAEIKQTGIVHESGDIGSEHTSKTFPILSGINGVFAYSPDGPWQRPVICSPIHGAWDAALQSIQGAKWVWIKEKPSDKEAQEGQFVWHRLSFTIARQQIGAATLTLWVDDFVKLLINGKFVRKISMPDNLVTVDIKSYLRPGDNVMLMEIENSASPQASGTSNPTGIIYRLDVH